MAKKKVVIIGSPQKEVVWSKKYQCNLTKEHAIFDDVQDSWINMNIEKTLKTKEV